jgi:hypothetical protein
MRSAFRLRSETEARETGTVKAERSELSIGPHKVLFVASVGTARELLTPL